MGTPAAPRIDDRLRHYIAGTGLFESPADVTRAVGKLAWELGLPRPSYQQVRHLMGGAVKRDPLVAAAHTSRGEVALRYVGKLWEYPGPGLADWYRRYTRGLV